MSRKTLAKAAAICSSWVMHSVATSFCHFTALSAQGFLVAGNNNNRANNNANRWRARA
jgi:hypothetical protein